MPTRGGRAKRPREATDSRRVTHNQSEQRRAKRINTHIDDIKTMLQSCGYLGERTDKGTILENAARFISDHVDSAPGGGGAGAAIGPMRDAPGGTSGVDYVQVFQQSGVAQAIAGMDGSFVDCNRRFSELSGFTRDEVQRRSIFNMTPAEDLQHTFEIVSELMGPTSSSMGKPVEVRQFSKPCKMRGGVVAVDVSMALLRDSHGRPSQFACAVVPSDATKGPGACGSLASLVGPPVDGEHPSKRVAQADPCGAFDHVSGFGHMSNLDVASSTQASEGLFGTPSAPPRLADAPTPSSYSPALAMHGMSYRAHTPSGMAPRHDQAAGVDAIAAAAIAAAGAASSSTATSLAMHPPQQHMGMQMHDLSARLGSRPPGSVGGGAFGRRGDVPVALALAQRARADRIRRAAAAASSAPGAPNSTMSSAAQAAILHDDAMRAAGFADDRSLLERSQEADPGHDPRTVSQAELGSLSRYRRHGVPEERALAGLHMPALNGPTSARARAYSASGMSDPIADHHHPMDVGGGGLSLLSAASIHHDADGVGRAGQASSMGGGRLSASFMTSGNQHHQGHPGGGLSHGMIGAGALSVNSQSQNGNGMLGAGALSVLSDAPQAFLGDTRGDLSLVSDAVGDGLPDEAEGDGGGNTGRYSTSSSQIHH